MAVKAAISPRGHQEDCGWSLQEKGGDGEWTPKVRTVSPKLGGAPRPGCLGDWRGCGRERGARIKNNQAGRRRRRPGGLEGVGGEWAGGGGAAVLTQEFVLTPKHFRQSTWPSSGKQPLSSASTDNGFPQSSHL